MAVNLWVLPDFLEFAELDREEAVAVGMWKPAFYA